MKKINEKHTQYTNYFRSDIYRKFEKQFVYIFTNPINIEDNEYVEHDTNDFKDAFDTFINNPKSDFKFFIGYTGTGKTTFIRHYFHQKTLGVKISDDKENVIIPISWDGKTVPDEGYVTALNRQISNVLDVSTKKIYKAVEEILSKESDGLLTFIEETRSDILQTLSIPEIIDAEKSKISISQYKLMKCQEANPVEFSSSILKYAVKNTPNYKIKRLIFIVDDVETIAQEKLGHIVNTYFKIYACMHNVENGPSIKLLFSLRPHSFRFLKKTIKHQHITSYGDPFEVARYRIIKNQIPSIKKIFKCRFENAKKNTPKPGNPDTWKSAQEAFYSIINDFDNNSLDAICDICHLNIRAITDSFQMILSNRLWCQNNKPAESAFTVSVNEYKFDVVRTIRTLACGENPVYTGNTELQFNPGALPDLQDRPSFDDSKVFIPNILANVQTGKCDVFPALIMQYLDSYSSSTPFTPQDTEFIARKTLFDNLSNIFSSIVKPETINQTIDYLFENRVIRKSIISNDSDKSLNQLLEEDSLYLTLKGTRLLSMFETDSVLLEIYREDILREYPIDKYYMSSLDLVLSDNKNGRYWLFEDLIKLCEEVFYNEDRYQTCVFEKSFLFYPESFAITTKLLRGIQNSINRAQSLSDSQKGRLRTKVSSLEKNLEHRKEELK